MERVLKKGFIKCNLRIPACTQDVKYQHFGFLKNPEKWENNKT